MAFGDLKIVPSANLGDLGSQQDLASVFKWKWHYNLPGFIAWFVLIAAIALRKSNHNINTLAIFLPIAVLNLLWLIFIKVISMPSSAESQYSVVIQSMVIGIAILWLTADFICKFGGFVRFMLSFGIMIVTAGLGILSYSNSFSMEIILFLVLSACMTFALLIAVTISRRFCRKKYSPLRFMLWHVLWMIILGPFATLIFFIIGSLIFSSWPSRLIMQLISVSLIGLVFGLLIYVINLPYMLLGFVNPFFRERFCACLNLKSMPAVTNADQSNEQI
ncbi:MAG: hypothetical protein JW715_10780 [Sedimentisphaerales bacterium]|nr:hypothetical protein [Sedimentisphaerales bacterium]